MVEGAHECMTTRGIHKRGVSMVTSKMLGSFLPYMLMIMMFAGAMQHGIYATAGEIEALHAILGKL